MFLVSDTYYPKNVKYVCVVLKSKVKFKHAFFSCFLLQRFMIGHRLDRMLSGFQIRWHMSELIFLISRAQARWRLG